MKKPAVKQPKSIANRRARHEYALDDSLMVGMVLTGKETKALRMGRGQLQGAYVTLRNGELWLVNSLIMSTKGIDLSESEQVRDRKLLAKKREISKLIQAKEQGKTIVPLDILTGGRYIKLRISAGRGKKLYDKRETLKKRDQERQVQRFVS